MKALVDQLSISSADAARISNSDECIANCVGE